MSDQFIPKSPKNIAIRPINKGMILNLPTNGLPDGSVTKAQNFIVQNQGPKRRPGWQSQAGAATIASNDRPSVDMGVLWNTAGTQKLLLIGTKFVHEVTLASGFTVKYWTYAAGTLSVSTTTATGSGTEWNHNFIQGGDSIILDADGSGDGPEEIAISSVTNDTTIVMATTPTGTYGAGTDYVIRRALQAASPYLVDFAVAENTLWVCDGDDERHLYEYDGTNFTVKVAYSTGTVSNTGTAVTGSGTAFDGNVMIGDYIVLDADGSSNPAEAISIASVDSATGLTLSESPTTNHSGVDYQIISGVTGIRAVCSFADRLWIANVYESSVRERQRIRWTNPANYNIFPAANFLDLPYTNGEILRLIPLGSMLIAYFDDCIYYGRATGITGLPYAFSRINTGGVGLVGTKAICEYLDGHFFVGQDDIYYLGADVGLKPIGSPVVRDTIRSCDYFNLIYVVPDPRNERIAFGFPTSNTRVEKVWSYYYKSQAWSYDNTTASFLAGTHVTTSTDWRLFRGTTGGALEDMTVAGTTDPSSAAIVGVIESGDYDFGLPNLNKTVSRLSVKVDNAPSVSLAFNAFGSVNRGVSFTSLGRISLSAGEDEGYVNFKETGSLFRWKLSTSSVVAPYTISEVVLRARQRGREV